MGKKEKPNGLGNDKKILRKQDFCINDVSVTQLSELADRSLQFNVLVGHERPIDDGQPRGGTFRRANDFKHVLDMLLQIFHLLCFVVHLLVSVNSYKFWFHKNMEIQDFLLAAQLCGSFVCFLMSVVGNFLVLTVMLGRKTVRQTSANYYIISIAFADLISGAFAIPFFVYGVCLVTCRNRFCHMANDNVRLFISRFWRKDRTTLACAYGWLHLSLSCLESTSTS